MVRTKSQKDAVILGRCAVIDAATAIFGFNFDPLGRAPIISALIVGPKGTRKVRLIFDPGAEMTQPHTARMAEVGYAQTTASTKASVVGVGGIEGDGYVTTLQKLLVVGAKSKRSHLEHLT